MFSHDSHGQNILLLFYNNCLPSTLTIYVYFLWLWIFKLEISASLKLQLIYIINEKKNLSVTEF